MIELGRVSGQFTVIKTPPLILVPGLIGLTIYLALLIAGIVYMHGNPFGFASASDASDYMSHVEFPKMGLALLMGIFGTILMKKRPKDYLAIGQEFRCSLIARSLRSMFMEDFYGVYYTGNMFAHLSRTIDLRRGVFMLTHSIE